MATTVTQSITVQSRTTMRIYVPIGFVRTCHRARALFEYSVVQLRRYEECQAPHQRIIAHWGKNPFRRRTNVPDLLRAE